VKNPTLAIGVLLFLGFLAGCAHVEQRPYVPPAEPASLSKELKNRILALDAEHLSEADIDEVLSKCPAPRVMLLEGSVRLVSMESFGRFLVAMGYPEDRVRDPRSGSYSYSSYADSQVMAGMIAWYYEREGMMPMVIGYSQGGMLSVRILHELSGTFHEKVAVWNPLSGTSEQRWTIVDPLTGDERPVVGLRMGFASAAATGKPMRLLLGQWAMLNRLREIPDTVEEFSGYHLKYDPISGTLFGVGQGDRYYPMGSASVRNIVLPSGIHHLDLPLTEDLARNRETRQWIQHYRPSRETGELSGPYPGEKENIFFAADLWYSIKRHWCLELKRWVLANEKLNY
jgi:hypothetical protein